MLTDCCSARATPGIRWILGHDYARTRSDRLRLSAMRNLLLFSPRIAQNVEVHFTIAHTSILRWRMHRVYIYSGVYRIYIGLLRYAFASLRKTSALAATTKRHRSLRPTTTVSILLVHPALLSKEGNTEPDEAKFGRHCCACRSLVYVLRKHID